ncbi:MAG: tryptophan--tRNA ligase [Candidatus Omnitrophica bacterium]|nr:tryptophan--tRNA ligase [Candidatus Omnitrophota bacterium]
MKKRLLSGMRPTGKMHLGHLFGALGNWTGLQDKYSCFFMVADWHALMSEYKNAGCMKEFIIEMTADWISAGVDPDKSAIFLQSDVKEHLELSMVLSDIMPLSWLERCPTYKEQLREIKGKDLTTYGFLGYPVLQAADILIYKAEAVPVGQDQLPHLELTREIARRFNHFYKGNIFPDPEPVLTKTSKILGLDNRKMSKSYDNFISLSDTADVIKKKASSMITDPQRIKKTDPGHYDICNVFSYYNLFKPETADEVKAWCKEAQKGCTECKHILADIIIKHLEPIIEKRTNLLKDKAYLHDVLKEGAKKASDVTAKTMHEVYKAIGMK